MIPPNGGAPHQVKGDLREVALKIAQLELEVLSEKHELTIQGCEQPGDIQYTHDPFRTLLFLVSIIYAGRNTMRGAPIHDDGIPSAINAKHEDPWLVTKRLSL